MKKAIILIVFILISLAGFCDKYVWNEKTSFPSNPRHRVSAISIGNKGYMGMGHITSGSISLAYSDWWQYDPATNAWTQKANYPLARFAVVGFTIGNKCYMGSGNEQSFGDKNEFFEYDPITNVWTPKANFPIAAGGNIAFTINGIGYMGFGNGVGLYSYTPATNIWAPISTPISPSDYSSSFVINNKAYILPAFGTTFYEFDPATLTTTTKAPFIGAVRFAAASFAVRNQGYVGMGAYSTDFKDFYFYDPATNIWDTIPKGFPGIRRHYVPSFVIGDNAYFGTGTNGTNLGDFWCYEWKISVGVEEINKDVEINIFPNPTSQFLNIQLPSVNFTSNLELKLYNLNGQEIISKEINESNFSLDVSNLSRGVYFSSIINSSNQIIYSKKIIIN